MKLGQIVLFYDRQGSDPQVGIVTSVHSDDNVNLKVIPDGDAGYMTFHPSVPRRIGSDHLYAFECGDGPKPPMSLKKAARKK